MSGPFSAHFEMLLPPGTQLNGIYEIDRPIGSGGMGEIYKGHTIATGDMVAIKMMLARNSQRTLRRSRCSAERHPRSINCSTMPSSDITCSRSNPRCGGLT
jgi:serine/threonine protein kinase